MKRELLPAEKPSSQAVHWRKQRTGERQNDNSHGFKARWGNIHDSVQLMRSVQPTEVVLTLREDEAANSGSRLEETMD